MTTVDELKREYQDAVIALVEFRKISNHFEHLAKLARKQQAIRAVALQHPEVGPLLVSAWEQEARGK